MAARKRFTPEEIIGKLREAEVLLATGKTVAAVLDATHDTRNFALKSIRLPRTVGL